MHRPLVSFFALILTVFVPPAVAQGDYLELYARHARPRAYVDAIVLPAPDGGDVHFSVRIPNSLLVFVREREPVAGTPFVARVELTVQVRSGDDLVAERTWRVAHAAESYESSTSRLHDLTGRIPIPLPPGDYTYRVLLGEEPGDVLPLATRTLHVPPFPEGAVGTPIALVTRDTSEFTPAILNGDVPYGADGSFLVPVTLPDAADGHEALAFTIWRLADAPRGETRRQQARVEDLDRLRWDRVQAETIELDDAELLAQGEVPAPGWVAYQPMPETVEGSSDASIEVLDAATMRTFLVPVPIDAASDAGARYALEVAVEGVGSAGRAIAPFAFHWRDMPIALHDAETAIRLLSFIESDMRIRALLQGTAADREVAFLQYWKERDPTPATPFNELMAEYYRRIDHAALTFRTGVGPIPDGLRTDQGRLYIVHGPPDHVERAFPPSGGVTETWTYDNGSRFVFWAASSLEPLALQRD